MRKLRMLLRILKLAGIGLLAAVLCYAVLALVLPRITVHSNYLSPDRGIEVFVESNGVHTDFILPVRASGIDWTQQLPQDLFEQVDGTYDYIALGWGDRGFYLEAPTWSDLEFTTAFKATFFLGSAAMHVTYLRFQPSVGDACRRLTLSEDQYRKLVEFLLASFARDDSGRLHCIDHAGYTPQDRFFDGAGKYSLIHTCNAWTGSGLRTMGIKTGLWTPFPWDVLRYLEQ